MPIDCVISYKNLHYRTFAALMQGRHGLLACGRNIVACTLPKPAGAWPGGKPQPRRHQVVGLSLQGGVAISAVRRCNTGRSATQNGTYRKTGCQRHAFLGSKPAMKRRPATNPKWPWRPANRLCRLPSAAFFWRSNLADSGPDRILPHGKPTCRMARHWQKPLD